MPEPYVSVIVATHNRISMLQKCLEALQSLTIPLEVIVADDGSSDGTEQMVREIFPEVIYRRYGPGCGPAFTRNQAVKVATHPIIFSIDDDTIICSSQTFHDAMALLEHPRVAAVALPHINVLKDSAIHNLAPADGGLWLVHSFVACAWAVRRDAFLTVHGFRPAYFYMGEESDLSIRLLARGWVVAMAHTIPMHHFQPADRRSRNAEHYGRRNDILLPTLNAPWRWLLPAIVGTVLLGLHRGWRRHHLWWTVCGFLAGFAVAVCQFRQRKPVSSSVYRAFRFMKKAKSPISLQKVESYLPTTPGMPYQRQ